MRAEVQGQAWQNRSKSVPAERPIPTPPLRPTTSPDYQLTSGRRQGNTHRSHQCMCVCHTSAFIVDFRLVVDLLGEDSVDSDPSVRIFSPFSPNVERFKWWKCSLLEINSTCVTRRRFICIFFFCTFQSIASKTVHWNHIIKNNFLLF